ncbi:Hypothetical protein PHPALM_15427 [Phytophthora palmivora]|uniref:Uncharacterized protein n=1 Tax=Phytophthora palmivora TaxID=4796 RepID=A0A2P4XS63_9STRA|nr:Hypothetical protein PHPALM_15427 [Phytophthora palmivora]
MYLSAVAPHNIRPAPQVHLGRQARPYRPRGAICTRNIETEDRSVYKASLLQFLFRGIKAKWPSGLRGRLEYPTDVPTTQFSPYECAGSWSVCVAVILAVPRTHARYRRYHSRCLRCISVYDQRDAGQHIPNSTGLRVERPCSNQYTLSHMVKDKLKQAGTLPVSLQCERSVNDRAVKALKVANNGRPPTISKK